MILNGIGAHHLAAFVSMLALGERAGIARRVLVDAFTSGAFASPSYIGKKEKVLSKDYQPEFALALALKDSKLQYRAPARGSAYLYRSSVNPSRP